MEEQVDSIEEVLFIKVFALAAAVMMIFQSSRWAEL
jgi:hypothetical protein